jgi:hypothetical protein
MKRKIAIMLAVLTACLLAFFGYRSIPQSMLQPSVQQCAAAADSVDLPAGKLALEGDPWSGYITTRSDDFHAALAKHGFDYSYHEELDQTKRACNMTAGSINLMVTTAGQYLKHRPAGKIVAMIDESMGADALVLNTPDYPYLKSMDQLPRLVREFEKKGKKPVLAYTGDSPSEELRDELSNISDELKLSDFELVSVDQSSTAFAKLQKHEAQVAIIWEPETTAARNAGYTVAMSSRDVPRRILDVIVASDRVIKENPAAVQAVVTEFYAARKANVAHAKDFLAAIAKDGSLKPEDAQAVLDGIHLFDANEADQFFNVRAYPLDEVPMSESLIAIAGIAALSDPSVKVTESMWNGTFAHKAAQALR